ncbi:MAG: aromatic-ring-hydroxylating dioxygenase subunit beta [Solirubrobacterales bacterium]
MTQAATGDGAHAGSELPFASTETHAEVRAFLDREAELIDDRRFAEWLELVDEDFTYRMPVPFTPDNPTTPAHDDSAFVIDETRETLTEHWFRRFEPEMWEMAWAENPPVRYRHFISNVRVREGEADGEYDVRSNAIVTGTRQSDPPIPLYVERFDRVIEDGGLRLGERFVIPEASLLEFAQLRVIL